eukprot:gene25254-30497_t
MAETRLTVHSASSVTAAGQRAELCVSWRTGRTKKEILLLHSQVRRVRQNSISFSVSKAPIEREGEAKREVDIMLFRQVERSRFGGSHDKSDNPLIAIPGSPGVGKSTFLVHLPDSQPYKEYLAQLYQKSGLPAKPPIVVPFIFNSEMSRGPESCRGPESSVRRG